MTTQETLVKKLKEHGLMVQKVIILADSIGKEYLMDKYNLTYEDIQECYKMFSTCPIFKGQDV